MQTDLQTSSDRLTDQWTLTSVHDASVCSPMATAWHTDGGTGNPVQDTQLNKEAVWLQIRQPSKQRMVMLWRGGPRAKRLANLTSLQLHIHETIK